MNLEKLILIPLLLPLASSVLILLISNRTKYLKEALSVLVTMTSLLASIFALKAVLAISEINYSITWLGVNIPIDFRVDKLSAFLLFAVSLFSFVISIYSIELENKGNPKVFYFILLLTQTASAGAVMSNNLISMFFFWESIVIFLYVFVYISTGNDYEIRKTALKTFLINGIADIAMMIGILMVGYIASTYSMSEISHSRIDMTALSTIAYILLLIGALTKAGAFPFHTWIPDAALNSNAPFMAYIPAAIDKLLGIYFLARISVYLYNLNTAMQIVLMTVGAVTIIVAVMMAFVQTDYKRLLSYHAVSQTGYMILGIGTLNPIGIAGGLFHMINHATYKSCLFMTAGSVEKQTGLQDITKLGGLVKRMPVTAVCFVIAALAISGIAPLNGYFSKELVYKGALFGGYTWFFIAAEVGSVLTLASFLKLGHSVFFGKLPEHLKEVKEAPLTVLIPMIILAAVCILFGFGAHFPISNLIEPSIESLGYISSMELAGFHFDTLFIVSLIVILVALVNHMIGYKLTNKPSKASDHIHYAPVLKELYIMAEKGYFDLYELFKKFFAWLARITFKTDRFFDKLIDTYPTAVFNWISRQISLIHNGEYNVYMFYIFAFIVVYIIYIGGIKW